LEIDEQHGHAEHVQNMRRFWKRLCIICAVDMHDPKIAVLIAPAVRRKPQGHPSRAGSGQVP
jgi:hypothetical protein